MNATALAIGLGLAPEIAAAAAEIRATWDRHTERRRRSPLYRETPWTAPTIPTPEATDEPIADHAMGSLGP
jgi:hypothetical protein